MNVNNVLLGLFFIIYVVYFRCDILIKYNGFFWFGLFFMVNKGSLKIYWGINWVISIVVLIYNLLYFVNKYIWIILLYCVIEIFLDLILFWIILGIFI